MSEHFNTKTWTYNYHVLSRLIGATPNAVQKHVQRGYLNPDDLESVFLYLARYARADLKKDALALIAEIHTPGETLKQKTSKKRPVKRG